MGDETTKAIVEAAKTVAPDLYRDGAKRTVVAFGNAAGAVAELGADTVQLFVDAGRAGIGWLRERLGRKLKDVPPERLQLPPATISGPAIMRYLLLGSGNDAEVLREMFENLLTASMDTNTATSAHPAFVNMIADLTPDEAWLLKSIDRDDYAVTHVYRMTDTGNVAVGFRTAFGEDLKLDPVRKQQFISNLDRLGILRISSETASDIAAYDDVERIVRGDFGEDGIVLHAGRLEVTPFGAQFLTTCVRTAIPPEGAGK